MEGENQRVMKGKGETHGNGRWGRERQGLSRLWGKGSKKYIYKVAFLKNLSYFKKMIYVFSSGWFFW